MNSAPASDHHNPEEGNYMYYFEIDVISTAVTKY